MNLLHRCLIVVVLLVAGMVYAGESPRIEKPSKAAVATAHPLATSAGFEILAQGGNAFDAAVAVSAALAVVEPAGSGLGGGGFWLLRIAKEQRAVMIDGRERAPLAARPDLYLDQGGAFNPARSINGALSAGIPGLPAGLVHLAEQYGKLSLAENLAPAIRYARQGFPVGKRYHKLAKFRLNVIRQSKAAAAIFLSQGEAPQPGYLLVQTDLAVILERLAKEGKAGFYHGEIAQKLVNGVRAAGGIWQLRDLADYKIVERTPIKGHYRGIEITSAAPPSSGGIVLVEALNILEGFDLKALNSVDRKHLIVEALRRAYHDRARYLGDADFVSMPITQLLSKNYAAGLSSTIRTDLRLSSQALAGHAKAKKEGEDTTHFSVLDQQGNLVAGTLSINYPFGSGFVVPGTGILLNDEMDDFAALDGAPNHYGLVGGEANAIAPGKRMLSSMTPTFLDDGQRVAIVGSPGGSRIISMVLLAVLDFAEGHGPESWVSVPRFHHQYLPDRIQYEPDGLSERELDGLKQLGHAFKPVSYRYGNMQAIQWDRKSGQVTAASDPRGEGLAEVK